MKIAILGIGNVMFGDEGVGVHLCSLLKQKYLFKSSVHELDFIDGGTLAQRLIPTLVEYEYILILDCVDANDGEIGDVYFFDFENVPESISWKGSAHEVEMLQTLTMMDMVGDRPPTKIIGIIPEVIDKTTLQMTDAVLKGAKLMEKIALEHLQSLGFECEKIDDLALQEVANQACQGHYE